MKTWGFFFFFIASYKKKELWKEENNKARKVLAEDSKGIYGNSIIDSQNIKLHTYEVDLL